MAEKAVSKFIPEALWMPMPKGPMASVNRTTLEHSKVAGSVIGMYHLLWEAGQGLAEDPDNGLISVDPFRCTPNSPPYLSDDYGVTNTYVIGWNFAESDKFVGEVEYKGLKVQVRGDSVTFFNGLDGLRLPLLRSEMGEWREMARRSLPIAMQHPGRFSAPFNQLNKALRDALEARW